MFTSVIMANLSYEITEMYKDVGENIMKNCDNCLYEELDEDKQPCKNCIHITPTRENNWVSKE